MKPTNDSYRTDETYIKIKGQWKYLYRAVDSTGTTLYSYTPSNGFLSKVTYPDGRILSYSYDSQGNITSLTDPFGSNSYYGYDSRNRLISVGSSLGDIEAQYSYYKNNLLNSTRQKNGVTSDFTYDGLQLSTLTQKKSDGSPLNTFNYSSYDNNGNQLTKMENGVSYSFTYDPLNRIQTSSQFDETFDYDNRGNRTSMTTNHPFDSPDVTRTFDKRDRLTNVALTSGGNVAYKYNGDGLLWERTENGQKTRYYWDGDQVIAEANVVGGVATLKARYIRGQGLVAREDGQGKAYYLQNGHGDVVNLMDSTGTTKLNSYSYDVFGNTVSQQENLPQPFKYSGEMMDDKVGLQYLRARWYDPSMGRFVGEDTLEGQLENPLSVNRFTYVKNNPMAYIDPTGHYPVCEGCSDNEQEKGKQDYYESRNPSSVSQKLVEFIINYEEFHSKPYSGQDNKNRTIGYGHLILNSEYFDELTEEEALKLLLRDLQVRVDTVSNWANKYNVQLNQQQFDAIVSFVFNAGEKVLKMDYSEVAKVIASGKYTDEQLRDEFTDWAHVTTTAGKIYSEGVYRRRMDEWQIFVSGDYTRDYPNLPKKSK